MGKHPKLTAHDLIRPAVDGLLERIQSDADRIVRVADDDEAVHDFRVGLRRLRTILRASRTIYGKKKVKRLEAAAKAFGDATSALRDAEVLEDTLRSAILDNRARVASEAWLDEVKAGEAALRDAAIALIEGPDLEAMCATTRKMLRAGPVAQPVIADYSAARFDDVRGGVRALLPVRDDDVDRLHRLRIRFKRLRYTCELLAQFMTVMDATGPRKKDRARAHQAATRFSSTARDAARMQKELGLLHDADQALLSLSSAPLPAPDRESIETALLDLRGRLVRKSITQLQKLPKRIVGRGPTVVTVETPLPARV